MSRTTPAKAEPGRVGRTRRLDAGPAEQERVSPPFCGEGRAPTAQTAQMLRSRTVVARPWGEKYERGRRRTIRWAVSVSFGGDNQTRRNAELRLPEFVSGAARAVRHRPRRLVGGEIETPALAVRNPSAAALFACKRCGLDLGPGGLGAIRRSCLPQRLE